MKSIFSPWSKAVKKAMIDRDLDTNDIADRFHWSRQYAIRIINGHAYHKDAVQLISSYLNIPIPGENETLVRKLKDR